jgi:streptogramin lyase
LLLTSACGSDSDGGDRSDTGATPDSSASPEASFEDQLQAEIPVEGEPDWMAVGYGSVWATRDESAAVDRIDPATNKAVATIDMGAHPCNGAVAAFGAIWVPSCGENALQRISPETNKVEATIDISIYQSFKGTPPSGGIAAGHGSIWMITKEDKDRFDVLARIDPQKNEIAEMIELGHVGGGVAVDASSIWVTVPDEGLLLRIDPGSGEVIAEIDGLVQPAFVAAGEDAVWVLSGTWDGHPEGDASVTKVDASTNEIETRIAIDERPGTAGNIAVGEGFVWARTSFTILAKIDPTTNAIVAQYPNEKGNGDVKVAFGSVWLSDFAFGFVWRLPV